jgi:hypothetical protein
MADPESDVLPKSVIEFVLDPREIGSLPVVKTPAMEVADGVSALSPPAKLKEPTLELPSCKLPVLIKETAFVTWLEEPVMDTL